MTPFSAAGTSIAALSVSSVIKPSSRSTASPGETNTSMTSTSSKSPNSGITMLIVLATPRALQRHRIGTVRIDAVFFDRLGNGFLIEYAVVGQRFERRNRDITLVYLEMLPQGHAPVGPAISVRA